MRIDDALAKSSKALRVSVAWIGLVGVVAAPVHAQDNASQSSYPERFWYHELLGEVTAMVDNAGIREGIVHGMPFRIPIVDLEDPAARAKGYRKALRRVLERLPTWPHEWPGDEAAAGREKIRRALGRDFTSYEEVALWMWSNSIYFRWSAEKGHLIVDEAAKQTGTPLIDIPLGPIEPWSYWYYQAIDLLDRVVEEGEWVRGWVVSAEGSAFRIQKSLLDDRAAKEKGYKLGLEEAMREFLEEEYDDVSTPAWLSDIERLTGLKLEGRDAWSRWWEANKDRLRLSEDGRTLVPAEQ